MSEINSIPKSESIELDGLTFRTTQFAAMKGFALLAKLAKLIGPALAALSGAAPDTDVATLAPALMGAMRDLDDAQMSALAAEILAQTSVMADGSGKKDFSDRKNIDVVFTGRLMLLFKVLGHAVRVNFADFFAGSAPAGAADPQ